MGELDDVNPNEKAGWGKFVTNMRTGSSQKGQMQREWSVARMRTVSFNLIQDPGTAAAKSVPAKVEALITFSVAGNSISRRINVVNGSSISAICEAIDVSMEDKSPAPPGFPYVGNSEYTINIITAPGSRAFSHQPPILQQEGQNVSDNHTYNIPADSGAIAAFITIVPSASPGPTNAQIVVTESANGITTRQWDGRCLGQWIPLSPGATAINVTNLSGTPISQSCQLGIDG